MSMRIIVFHDLKIIRNLIKNYILTEYHDAIVDIAPPLDALKMLDVMKYDVVLCDQEMVDMNALKVRDYMLNTTTNRKAPFIMMTSTYNEAQREKMMQGGIRNILTIPFTSLHLREMINEVCDPRKRRAFARYIIPMSRAVIKLADQEVQSDIINISSNGILCEFICPSNPPKLTIAGNLNFYFPSDYSSEPAKDIIGRLIRLNVESWNDNYSAQRIRVSWEFIKIPEESKRILETVFEKAQHEIVTAEEIVKNENR
ncbi:MAG: response regulator [Desulfobacterales bacterium]|nr:response regulator [Desulfobacterales bacterium]MBF0395320.1 response regulator [Desulfobacterales bacterium]